jgi:hypothetical protein
VEPRRERIKFASVVSVQRRTHPSFEPSKLLDELAIRADREWSLLRPQVARAERATVVAYLRDLISTSIAARPATAATRFPAKKSQRLSEEVMVDSCAAAVASQTGADRQHCFACGSTFA